VPTERALMPRTECVPVDERITEQPATSRLQCRAHRTRDRQSRPPDPRVRDSAIVKGTRATKASRIAV
jgi:hypothetical protein